MDLERKGQQSYQGDLYVRFLGFGNGSLKALYDRSEGFFRRQIILTTRPKDASRTDDPFIAEKMCAEAEAYSSGVLMGCGGSSRTTTASRSASAHVRTWPRR